jgi:hypothetical protein
MKYEIFPKWAELAKFGSPTQLPDNSAEKHFMNSQQQAVTEFQFLCLLTVDYTKSLFLGDFSD